MVVLFLPDGINSSKRESLIRQLHSKNYFESSSAVNQIIKNKVYEVLPIIQADFWRKDLIDKEMYLEVMVGLKYRFSKNYIYALYDSIEEKAYKNIDSIDAKLNLTLLLFKLNDFSKIDYLHYNTNSPRGKRHNFMTIDTWWYLLDIPEYEQLAKSTLLRLIEESEYEHDRTRALFWLEEKYKGKITPALIELFPSLSNTYVKQIIIKDNLRYGDFKVVSNLLKETILRDTSEALKSTAAVYLFKHLNVPSNYLLIKKYIRELKYPKVFNYFVEKGVLGKPYLPKSFIKTEEMIDSTISYLVQCKQYNWIGKKEFILKLKSKLSEARKSLISDDTTTCFNHIICFQNEINQTYKDSLNTDSRFVSVEGFMFLYWNAQYILDRLTTPNLKKE